MGILLGLLTAVTWGGSDFLARFATQRIGTLRSMFYMQATGLVLLSICLPWLGGWGHLHDGSGWQPWAWGIFAGCINAFSTLTLYRSFEMGKMAVVAPLSASYPALTVTLSLLTGERLTAARAAGNCLHHAWRCAGRSRRAGSACRRRRSQRAQRQRTGLGAVFRRRIRRALLAAGKSHRAARRRAANGVDDSRHLRDYHRRCLLAIKQPIGLPRGHVRWYVWGMGLLDTSAFVISNRGMQLEQVAIVSVLGSLYGAVTVGLAAVFLREHVAKWQWAGIATIFAGILLISL